MKYHCIEYDGKTKYLEIKVTPYDYFIKKAE
jgi:hypothetical protein